MLEFFATLLTADAQSTLPVKNVSLVTGHKGFIVAEWQQPGMWLSLPEVSTDLTNWQPCEQPRFVSMPGIARLAVPTQGSNWFFRLRQIYGDYFIQHSATAPGDLSYLFHSYVPNDPRGLRWLIQFHLTRLAIPYLTLDGTIIPTR